MQGGIAEDADFAQIKRKQERDNNYKQTTDRQTDKQTEKTKMKKGEKEERKKGRERAVVMMCVSAKRQKRIEKSEWTSVRERQELQGTRWQLWLVCSTY